MIGAALACASSALAVRAHADAAGWAWHGPAALGGGQAPAWGARALRLLCYTRRVASEVRAHASAQGRDGADRGVGPFCFWRAI